MNIVLTGMRGTGKSSIGQVMAERLGFRFVDTDTCLEAAAGCTIAQLVHRHGWEHFRALERGIVQRVAAAEEQVIAAGGGTLIDPDNAACLKARGIVVLLLCDTAVLQRRIAAGSTRPSLTGTASAVDELEHIWQARKERYHDVADVTYDVSEESGDSGQDVQQKAAAIQALLRRFGLWRCP